MCGIAGFLNLNNGSPISEQTLREMILAIRHRGPDEFGLYKDDFIGLACARLSIIDLAGGQQPISNEDGSLWIVFNGEIFNYVELRAELEARNHRFTTETDTEVIIHLYEEYGPACLNQLNGQFAIALWDTRERSLLLARDRLGIRPLYYTMQGGSFVFGSEVKALLAQPNVHAEIDPEALQQVFTYWSPLTPRSIFRNIRQVSPGHYLIVKSGTVSLRQYWSLGFSSETQGKTEDDYLEEFEQLLTDAVRIRLRADVPVGAYLSGGIDSSVIAAIISNHSDIELDTFSIAFADRNFDESGHQRRMADFLGTQHQELFCTDEDIARVFPEVIWHTESPILRTAPAPMFLLSGLVNTSNYKVVLTGEGADEILAGYGIFKEMRARRFWARQPDSRFRPTLLKRLYPDIPGLSSNEAFLKAFFGKGLANTSSPFYSHSIRWENTGRIKRFLLGHEYSGQFSEVDAEENICLPSQFENWSSLAKAQYLEIVTFLSTYLLSSQGDRVSMAHSVEGRYPFLDHRVVEFCNHLPDDLKQRGLIEKWLLKRMAMKYIPKEIWRRTKRPYRAPIQRTFFPVGYDTNLLTDLLSPSLIKRSGYFKPKAVEMLVKKARGEITLSEVDEMALVGILSTQLVDQMFVQRERVIDNLDVESSFKVVNMSSTQ